MNTPDNNPTFCVILTTCDDARKIEENLPVFLEQEYEPGYQVIIVDMSSTDDTADVLKSLKADHKNLYTTFLPKYQFQPNRRKMALTIGVKAAKQQWIVFADISTPPPSGQWIAELAEALAAPTVLALGYISRKTGDVRLQTFEDLDKARSIVSKTEHKHDKAHHVRLMRYLRGCYDFMVVDATRAHDLLRLFGDEKYKLQKGR